MSGALSLFPGNSQKIFRLAVRVQCTSISLSSYRRTTSKLIVRKSGNALSYICTVTVLLMHTKPTSVFAQVRKDLRQRRRTMAAIETITTASATELFLLSELFYHGPRRILDWCQ